MLCICLLALYSKKYDGRILSSSASMAFNGSVGSWVLKTSDGASCKSDFFVGDWPHRVQTNGVGISTLSWINVHIPIAYKSTY